MNNIYEFEFNYHENYIINYIKSISIFFHFDRHNKLEFLPLVTSDIAITKHIKGQIILASIRGVKTKRDFSFRSNFYPLNHMQFVLFIITDQDPPIFFHGLRFFIKYFWEIRRHGEI